MHWIDATIIGLFFALMLALGLALRRSAARSIDSYFLGNRSMSWWMLGASGMASNVDMAGTMLIASLIFTFGYSGFYIELRGGIVLIMAFYLAFMGKWTRRSGKMTVAEWMTFRFGDAQGTLPRLLSAVFNIVFFIWAIAYFAVATNKFFEVFLLDLVATPELAPRYAALCSVGLILIVMLYTMLSGFAGVVWSDVLQGAGILLLAVYIAVRAFLAVGATGIENLVSAEWLSLLPPRRLDVSEAYRTFELLQLAIGFYLLKTVIDGMSGSGGYLAQRYFAARNERECGLLSLFWLFLMSFRWPLIMGIAVLGLTLPIPVADPELVLPHVIRESLPVGVRGLMLISLLGAAMSTYSSFMNAGSSYFVKDIYQRYCRRQAGQRELVWVGYASTVAFVVAGLVAAYQYTSINDVWGWLTMGLGAGLLLPNFLRWYWHRLNGYGYAAGAVVGMGTAFLIPLRPLGLTLNEYETFAAIGVATLVALVAVSWLTPAVPLETLRAFYRTTRPFGLWGPVRRRLAEDEQRSIRRESRRDIAAALLAVPWQLVLFLLPMAVVIHQWRTAGALALLLAALSVGLYIVWYRALGQATAAPPMPPDAAADIASIRR
jgi:SSS family solute:Na+ symporter